MVAAALTLCHGVPEQLRAATGDRAIFLVFLVEIKPVAIKVVRPIVLAPFIESIKRVKPAESRQILRLEATEVPFADSM
jgi:hypothetical protein